MEYIVPGTSVASSAVKFVRDAQRYRWSYKQASRRVKTLQDRAQMLCSSAEHLKQLCREDDPSTNLTSALAVISSCHKLNQELQTNLAQLSKNRKGSLKAKSKFKLTLSDCYFKDKEAELAALMWDLNLCFAVVQTSGNMNSTICTTQGQQDITREPSGEPDRELTLSCLYNDLPGDRSRTFAAKQGVRTLESGSNLIRLKVSTSCLMLPGCPNSTNYELQGGHSTKSHKPLTKTARTVPK